MSKLIRIEEISLSLNEAETTLKGKIALILGLEETTIIRYQIIKKAIDSRKKTNIQLVYSVDVEIADEALVKEWGGRYRVRPQVVYHYQINKAVADWQPVVVGAGPAGLFCTLALSLAGLKPILLERGESVEERTLSVANFFKHAKLNPESNVQFGEGGAGTFSDGKLYTLINDPRSSFVFKELVKAGAPEDILTSATPHIGTDNLKVVVKNLRQRIISLGGEVRFNSKMTDLEIKHNHLTAVIVNGKERLETNTLVIAIGHSARDTYELLYSKKLNMEAKPFAIGVRIEHLREDINKAQYGSFYNHPKLSTAKYKLVEHVPGERAVYTFCMCPGGSVIAAASEIVGVVTNGMSLYGQNNINSNSALLVPVKPEDFDSSHPLSGLDFQRKWEQKAYELGGGDYKAPAQLVGDFLQKKPSTKIGKVPATYLPGIKLTAIDDCLPDYVVASLRKALPQLNLKIKGFADPEALLTAVETRSSAPLRILRSENYQSNILGIYPCGEGAGYAGGITSSAIDGLSVAEAIINNQKI